MRSKLFLWGFEKKNILLVTFSDTQQGEIIGDETGWKGNPGNLITMRNKR
jgi:hypothetical protein